MIDVGEQCIYCDQSVAWGSGLYVNRIPADDGEKTGFACSTCLLMECDVCGELSSDIGSSDMTSFKDVADVVCDDCVAKSGGWED